MNVNADESRATEPVESSAPTSPTPPASSSTPPDAAHSTPPGEQQREDATHPAPREQPARLDENVQQEADAAMEAAMGGAAAPSQAQQERGREQAAGHRAPIRGPRVVQGGREHRTGAVVSVGPEDIFVEFGPKELGVVPRLQYTEEDLPKVGEQTEVVVERFDAKESLYICTRPGAVQKADWELLEPGQIVEATVTGTNKGGLQLEVAHHEAFMPASHVDLRRIEDLTPFVGQKLACKVIRIDRSGRGNITLSRRDILKEQQKETVGKLKDTLKEGDEIEGVVKKIMPYGAFVDMGGIDGLLHISDLSHDRVRKVEDVVKEGQTLKVKVLKLDWENDRHSLGLKQLEPDPFEEGLKEINEGDEASGRVTKLLDFGCFVEIAPGVEGLVHISELDWKRIEKTSDAVQPNQVVKVKVLKIEPESRKISLSIKQTKERPEPQGGPRGGGRGRREESRSAEEIMKETPALRRLREKAKQREKAGGAGGLGNAGGLGMGLGDLKL